MAKSCSPFPSSADASACGHTAFSLRTKIVSELRTELRPTGKANPLPDVRVVSSPARPSKRRYLSRGTGRWLLREGHENASIRGAAADVDRAWGIAMSSGCTDTEADDFVCKAGIRAAALVKGHWPAAEALATELLGRGGHSGKAATGVPVELGCCTHIGLLFGRCFREVEALRPGDSVELPCIPRASA